MTPARAGVLSGRPARGAALALPLVLAGCMLGFGGPREAPATVAVAGGEVTVAGPDGYCIDRAALRDAGDGAFVLLGSCAALSGNPRAPHPLRAAVLTAAVSGDADGPPVAALLPQLPAFMRSPAGRAALARNGDPASVTVEAAEARDGALWLRVRDEGTAGAPAVEPGYVRVVFDLGPRIVTLSVMAPAGRPIAYDAAEAVLAEFLRAVRAANADGLPPVRDAAIPVPPPPGAAHG